ncbi:MAG: hypothetical protein VYE22_09890 [Myxococcota bacterium]|nr:hypothetical protein [Myxococcota bacterium]
MAKNSNSSKASGGAAVSGGAVRSSDSSEPSGKGDEPKPKAPPDERLPEEQPREGAKASADGSEKGKTKAPFTVAKGKSVSSRRGILGPGDEVSARDFAAGAERLDELVDAGVLVKA